MAEEKIRPLKAEHHEDGSVMAHVRLTPTEDKMRAFMTVPPTTVVPVIFVPGIMGSNLRNAKTKKSVWNTNSTLSIMLQWAFRSAKTRQKKLSAKDVEVDPTGRWYGESATVPNEKSGLKSGQGTTSRAFYGDFVQWLDNELSGDEQANEGFFHHLWDGITGDGDTFQSSPWKNYEDPGSDEIETLKGHAEKPFNMLTGKLESDPNGDIWGSFYCPVHVAGYNWLQSNGDSGQDLARQVDAIIKHWNGQTLGKKGPKLDCKQVILVSHSMGGLVARAAVHDEYGKKVVADITDKVLGIVHGEQPANGAAAAYHHCRSGYGGISGLVLGRNAAQVTAVFANSRGAMELLPNQQYPPQWLKARIGENSEPKLNLPKQNPYLEIYLEKKRWWRLTDPALIDPANKSADPWHTYTNKLFRVKEFHTTLAVAYHHCTFVHYGADVKEYPAFGDLIWQCDSGSRLYNNNNLRELASRDGSNPVSVIMDDGKELQFSIVDPGDEGYPQPGDGTVPACSGQAPYKQGGTSIKQSFRLLGFDHQSAFDNETVHRATLYAIGMILQKATVL